MGALVTETGYFQGCRRNVSRSCKDTWATKKRLVIVLPGIQVILFFQRLYTPWSKHRHASLSETTRFLETTTHCLVSFVTVIV